MKAKPPLSALSRRIMREQEEARQAAWAARARGEEHIRNRPRDVWVITTLGRGALEADLVDAALHYAGLLEVALAGNAKSSSLAERVSGARVDPHLGMARICDDVRDQVEAYSFVRQRSARDDMGIFDATFATPHRSISALRKALGIGYGRLVAGLEVTLEHLREYFDEARPAERRTWQTPDEFVADLTESLTAAAYREQRRRELIEATTRPLFCVDLDPTLKVQDVTNDTTAALMVQDGEKVVAVLRSGESMRFERVLPPRGRYARVPYWRAA